MTGDEFRNKIAEIRRDLYLGTITYDEAKAKAQPIIDEMNRAASDIAAKYGKKHHGFSFVSLMR